MLRFKSAKTPEKQTELINQIAELAKRVNIRSSNTAAPERWGDFRSNSYMYLYLNLDYVSNRGLVEFVRLMDQNIKGIKSVKIETQGDLSSAFNETLNLELYQKNLSEMNCKEGYRRFRTYYSPIGFPDVLIKISSNLEKRQLTTFLNDCIAKLNNVFTTQIRLIEYPSEISDNTLIFNIDFGDAEESALQALLSVFEKSNFSIKRINVL